MVKIVAKADFIEISKTAHSLSILVTKYKIKINLESCQIGKLNDDQSLIPSLYNFFILVHILVKSVD